MNYYRANLSSEKLRRVYEIAPPRVRQYLQAEIDFVLSRLHSSDCVLELGCGYGRVLSALVANVRSILGIDTSFSSLMLARKSLSRFSNCQLWQMNALHTAFRDQSFDCVICIQNGISAFHVDQKSLIRESLRITKKGGRLLFSSYSDKFWPRRLEWFRLQAEEGLIGEIDEERTSNGRIVCKDGFTAETINAVQFTSLLSGFNVEYQFHEVDESSLFCEIISD